MTALNHSSIVPAIQSNQAGLSFGGAGFLIFYYIGIVDVLSKIGVLKPGVKLAGCSSGALVTTGHCSGLSAADIYKAGLQLAHTCKGSRSCSGTLDTQLRHLLQETLPHDAWTRCQNQGFISISTGQLLLGDSRPLLVSDFHSQDDLIHAMAASSFIPLWSGSSLVSHFRGMQAYDGGFSLFQPCPPDVVHCIRISTRNPSWPDRSSLDSFMSRLRVVAAPKSNIHRSFPPIAPTGKDGGADPALLELAASKNVDIAPGIYNKVSFTQQDWSTWALVPADDATLHHMYELGKADAEGWARHVGISSSLDSTAAERRPTAAAAATTATAVTSSKAASSPSGRRLKLAGA